MQRFSCWSNVGAVLLLAGCASVQQPMGPVSVPEEARGAAASVASALPAPAPAPAPAQVQQASCHPDPLRGAAAQAGPLTALTPPQAQADGAVDARVCWSGGLRTLTTFEAGRVCMVLLYAEAGPEHWRWPQHASFFQACTSAGYDPALLAPFTQMTVSGKVTGRAEFMGLAIPTIEIDALYRFSDCLQGETAPSCVHGYLPPLKTPP